MFCARNLGNVTTPRTTCSRLVPIRVPSMSEEIRGIPQGAHVHRDVRLMPLRATLLEPDTETLLSASTARHDR